MAATRRRTWRTTSTKSASSWIFLRPSQEGPTSGRQYEVVRLLPVEAGQFLYRIKSKAEAFERMAKESELSRRAIV